MIGIIKRPNINIIKPIDLDDYFDPSTHTATEENFIKFLEAGVYTEDVIGYKVQLSNSAGYSNGIWVIADVNHDSANTGQNNCYDLISQDLFDAASFSSIDNNWRNNTYRTWLSNTFYNGFSTEFKNHILNLKYKSRSTQYTDDKIILPSKVEVNGGITSGTDNEGVAYPIFTDDSSRRKLQRNSTYYRSWWTRSRYTNDSNNVWFVNTGGSINYYVDYTSQCYLAPLMRVS